MTPVAVAFPQQSQQTYEVVAPSNTFETYMDGEDIDFEEESTTDFIRGPEKTEGLGPTNISASINTKTKEDYAKHKMSIISEVMAMRSQRQKKERAVSAGIVELESVTAEQQMPAVWDDVSEVEKKAKHDKYVLGVVGEVMQMRSKRMKAEVSRQRSISNDSSDPEARRQAEYKRNKLRVVEEVMAMRSQRLKQKAKEVAMEERKTDYAKQKLAAVGQVLATRSQRLRHERGMEAAPSPELFSALSIAHTMATEPGNTAEPPAIVKLVLTAQDMQDASPTIDASDRACEAESSTPTSMNPLNEDTIIKSTVIDVRGSVVLREVKTDPSLSAVSLAADEEVTNVAPPADPVSVLADVCEETETVHDSVEAQGVATTIGVDEGVDDEPDVVAAVMLDILSATVQKRDAEGTREALEHIAYIMQTAKPKGEDVRLLASHPSPVMEALAAFKADREVVETAMGVVQGVLKIECHDRLQLCDAYYLRAMGEMFPLHLHNVTLCKRLCKVLVDLIGSGEGYVGEQVRRSGLAADLVKALNESHTGGTVNVASEQALIMLVVHFATFVSVMRPLLVSAGVIDTLKNYEKMCSNEVVLRAIRITVMQLGQKGKC
jgi:hypothetical protein